ncbi:MAG: SigE family RNA polymerase sigma factor [Nakamurella sp.]
MGNPRMSGATGGATSPPGSATARDGLVAAFVTEHAASLFRTALLLTGDRHRAEDLVQDVLTMLLPKWHRVAEAERPVAYVRRSLANQFISANRRCDTQVLLLGEVPEVDPKPDHADAVASSVTLWPMLRELPPRQRAAVVLRYFHGWTDVEIAAALDCRRGTARSLISRGLEALRSTLTTDGSDAEPRTDPAVPLTDQEVGR